MQKTAKIYVAGHSGLVGSAIVRNLESKGYNNIIYRTHKELDLINKTQVDEFFKKEKPEYVILAAAKVGGILANNTYRAEFIYDNLMIEANIIDAAYKNGVTKLLFLGSSCIYPKFATQPMDEEQLLTSELEYTNEPYAIAKIAGIKLCESYNLQYGTNFISAMPTNLYGINDNFDLEKSHVLPAMIRKFHLGKLLRENKKDEIISNLKVENWEEAESILNKHNISSEYITLWGTGTPKREFLFVDDLAEGCVFLLNNINFSNVAEEKKEIRNTHINIGTGEDVSISELAEIVKKTVGFEGDIKYDTTKPDGTPRKLMDVSKINKLGWKATVSLEEGIKRSYEWFKETYK